MFCNQASRFNVNSNRVQEVKSTPTADERAEPDEPPAQEQVFY